MALNAVLGINKVLDYYRIMNASPDTLYVPLELVLEVRQRALLPVEAREWPGVLEAVSHDVLRAALVETAGLMNQAVEDGQKPGAQRFDLLADGEDHISNAAALNEMYSVEPGRAEYVVVRARYMQRKADKALERSRLRRAAAAGKRVVGRLIPAKRETARPRGDRLNRFGSKAHECLKHMSVIAVFMSHGEVDGSEHIQYWPDY